MKGISNSHIQEIVLMRSFLLSQLGSKSVRDIAAVYFGYERSLMIETSFGEASNSSKLNSQNSSSKKNYRKRNSLFGVYESYLLPLFFMILLFAYIAMVTFFIFQYAISSLSSNTSGVWFWTIVFAILEDVIVLQPLYIYSFWIAIPSLIIDEISSLKTAVMARFEMVMQRTTGVTENNSVHSLIQQFHPVCRVARLFPSTPTSRFLLSLNDYDVVFAQGHTPCLTRVFMLLNVFNCAYYGFKLYILLPLCALLLKVGTIDKDNWLLYILLVGLVNGVIFTLIRYLLIPSTIWILFGFFIVILGVPVLLLFMEMVKSCAILKMLPLQKTVPFSNEFSDISPNNSNLLENIDENEVLYGAAAPMQSTVLYMDDGFIWHKQEMSFNSSIIVRAERKKKFIDSCKADYRIRGIIEEKQIFLSQYVFYCNCFFRLPIDDRFVPN